MFLRFQKHYFFVSLLLFTTLVVIALFVRDSLLRPYGGDFLVVIWLYTLIRALTSASIKQTALFVMGVALLVECLQYLQFTAYLGIAADTAAGIAIGSSFDWLDLLLYASGTLFSMYFDQFWSSDMAVTRSRH